MASYFETKREITKINIKHDLAIRTIKDSLKQYAVEVSQKASSLESFDEAIEDAVNEYMNQCDKIDAFYDKQIDALIKEE